MCKGVCIFTVAQLSVVQLQWCFCNALVLLQVVCIQVFELTLD
jgi:hypothetical protein